jgi:hypothetical protein
MRLLSALLAVAALPACASDFFEARIRPVLAQCQACHGPKLRTAGLDFTTEQGFRRVDPARVLEVISYEGKVKMPPTGKLAGPQIADLAAWLKAGAAWPKAETRAKQANLWSVQPLRDPPPPPVRNRGWVRNPIDQFLLSVLEAKGLRPAPPASKPALLRRVTFDLTGLPPTEQEIRDFLADRSPQAYEKVVERLLASPRYGERWGRHWLDVARYADSTGADEDHRYPHAWRYRDYVIDAFNRDLPYDRFIMEQIAGDLLPPDKPGDVNVNGIVATGFLALGPRLIAEQDKPKMVYDFIDEQIDVVSRGILGLTISCARCHDHKFDPITIQDYYALAGIFASAKVWRRVEGTVSQMYLAPLAPAAEYAVYETHQKKIEGKKRELEQATDAERKRYVEQLLPQLPGYLIAARTGRPAAELDPAILKKWRDYLKPGDDVRPHLEAWEKASETEWETVAKSYQARFAASLEKYENELARWRRRVQSALENQMPPPDRPGPDLVGDRFFAEVYTRGPFSLPKEHKNDRIEDLKGELEALEKASPPEPPMAVGVADGPVVEQRVFLRGNVHNPGDPVPKRFPAVLAGQDQAPITQGSGRLELARWLVRPDHPLTARVMVNRIWQWHFGEGLVRTPSNWGTLGEPPTHPELLDWLAKRFIESGWSVKAMHRLILSSAAYRMSSEVSDAAAQADPSNRLWSRFNRRRLDVEEIRDAMLQIDGSLDLTMGGTLQKGTGTDGENAAARLSYAPEKSYRRTVYLPLRRSNLPTLLNLFDFGDATTTGEGRARTNVAPQALFMMNSQFVADRAAGLAKRVNSDVARTYLSVLGRKPTAEEAADARRYAGRAGFASLCKVLLASNEFIYVD